MFKRMMEKWVTTMFLFLLCNLILCQKLKFYSSFDFENTKALGAESSITDFISLGKQ